MIGHFLMMFVKKTKAHLLGSSDHTIALDLVIVVVGTVHY